MSLLRLVNNQFVLTLGIKLCQLIPKQIALPILERLSTVISRFKGANLIQAIQSNQLIVSGMTKTNQKDLDQSTQAVIHHALVCHYDFFHNLDDLDRMSRLVPSANEFLEELDVMTAGTGALIISPHLSNFNLFFQVITYKGFTCKLLTFSNLNSGYDLINEIRMSVGAEIIPVDNGNNFSELVEYLKSDGYVATGVDRPIQDRKPRNRLQFFGKPSDLPAGYLSLALAADVPVIILSVRLNEDGVYDYELAGPINLEQHSSRLETLTRNAENILSKIEPLIERVPEQWLMYYPVWPQARKGTT